MCKSFKKCLLFFFVDPQQYHFAFKSNQDRSQNILNSGVLDFYLRGEKRLKMLEMIAHSLLVTFL